MQFVLGPRSPDGFEAWQRFEISDSLHLLAHPELHVDQAGNVGVSATLIGYVLDPRDPRAGNVDILNKLISHVSQDGDLFEALAPLGGRWALIFNDGQRLKLVGDATGLRQIFHSDVAQTNELWCASQPNHMATVLGIQPAPEAQEFIEWFQAHSPESWWPGDSSPYRELKRLLPNHYLDLATGQPHRFWPRTSLPVRPLKDAVGGISEILAGMMQSAAKRFDLAVAMSAGWDSRLMLAASRSIARDIAYYTAKRPDMAWTHMDIHIPTRLLTKLKLRHDIIEHSTEASPEFTAAYNNNVPFAHGNRLAPLQSELNYYKRTKVGVTGNVSEVARCFYPRPDAPGHAVTAEDLTAVTDMDHPFARARFSAWLKDLGDPLNYNILDLFYWEQRAGSWFAHNCLEFDMAWQDIFIPFNSRGLLKDMLSVDECDRQGPQYELYRQLMLKLWPAVLSQPINPTHSRKGMRRILSAIRRRLRSVFRQD